MLKQIKLLSGLLLCNLFGINELRHSKDKKAKLKYAAMAFLWLLLIAFFVTYVVMFSVGMAEIGVAGLIPMLLYTVVSLVMLVFTFLKAGSVLFSMKTYEMLISMPFFKSAIVVSRFMNMYITNLMLGVIVMLPGSIVYVIYEKPGVMFYIAAITGLLFVPLLPMTIASIGGAIITAISSKMKYKSIGEALLMMAFVVLIMFGSMFFGNNSDSIGIVAILDIAGTMKNAVASVYPPAAWFMDSIDGNILSLILMVVVPSAVFAVFAMIVGKYFQKICAAINAVNAKNNYKMEHLSKNSIIKALCKKELKRYFSSGIYISNTIVGYVMGVILAIAMLVTGIDTVISILGLFAGREFIEKLVPFILSLTFCMAVITASSISMEGKNFWQLLSLPIRNKDVYKAKILTNIIVALPFWLVCSVILCIAVRPSVITAIWYFVIPAVYICFMSVFGLVCNLLFPVFNWDNEVRVVKQSASVSIAMFSGMALAIAPVGVIFALSFVNTDIVIAIVLIVLIAVMALLYKWICSRELIKIGEGK